MKKLFTLIICICLVLLSSCDVKDTSSHPDIEVKLPDGTTIDGSNSLPDNIDKNNVSIAEPDKIVDYYVGSNTTKKFHLKDCEWAKKLKEENRVYFSGYNEFIENGYTPCKTCNP